MNYEEPTDVGTEVRILFPVTFSQIPLRRNFCIEFLHRIYVDNLKALIRLPSPATINDNVVVCCVHNLN